MTCSLVNFGTDSRYAVLDGNDTELAIAGPGRGARKAAINHARKIQGWAVLLDDNGDRTEYAVADYRELMDQDDWDVWFLDANGLSGVMLCAIHREAAIQLASNLGEELDVIAWVN